MVDERTNRAIEQLLSRARRLRIAALDPELGRYLTGGVALSDGSLVSVAAAGGAHVSRSQFTDRVGYEALINKIHFDDWCSDALTDVSVEEKLAHALLLSDAVGASAVEHCAKVAVVISVDPDVSDVVFRFYGVRADEPPWLANIDGYAEPVLLRIYSSDE